MKAQNILVALITGSLVGLSGIELSGNLQMAKAASLTDKMQDKLTSYAMKAAQRYSEFPNTHPGQDNKFIFGLRTDSPWFGEKGNTRMNIGFSYKGDYVKIDAGYSFNISLSQLFKDGELNTSNPDFSITSSLKEDKTGLEANLKYNPETKNFEIKDWTMFVPNPSKLGDDELKFDKKTFDFIKDFSTSMNNWQDTDDTTYSTIPEPLTILGSLTALGFGAYFKRKLS